MFDSVLLGYSNRCRPTSGRAQIGTPHDWCRSPGDGRQTQHTRTRNKHHTDRHRCRDRHRVVGELVFFLVSELMDSRYCRFILRNQGGYTSSNEIYSSIKFPLENF